MRLWFYVSEVLRDYYPKDTSFWSKQIHFNLPLTIYSPVLWMTICIFDDSRLAWLMILLIWMDRDLCPVVLGSRDTETILRNDFCDGSPGKTGLLYKYTSVLVSFVDSVDCFYVCTLELVIGTLCRIVWRLFNSCRRRKFSVFLIITFFGLITNCNLSVMRYRERH